MHDKIPHYNVWCAGLSEVEIDVLTGEKRVLRYKVEVLINKYFKSSSDFFYFHLQKQIMNCSFPEHSMFVCHDDRY